MDPIPIVAGAAAVGAAALAARAFLVEPARVEVTRHELSLPGLPPTWEGRTLVHLTDLHYGDPRSHRLMRWMVRTVNALEPDLVVITGDFILRRPSECKPCASFVGELRAKHGVLGVLGDHDYDKRREPVPLLLELLEQAGVRLLRNEALELPGGLTVAGTDPHSRKIKRADLPTALSGLRGGKPHLLLTHSPDLIPQASEAGVPMVLCGHTHGGQVVVPFYGPPVTHTRVPRQFASGWSRMGETRMYTCRGLASHYSLRFLCRPEIAVFTLRAG